MKTKGLKLTRDEDGYRLYGRYSILEDYADTEGLNMDQAAQAALDILAPGTRLKTWWRVGGNIRVIAS